MSSKGGGAKRKRSKEVCLQRCPAILPIDCRRPAIIHSANSSAVVIWTESSTLPPRVFGARFPKQPPLEAYRKQHPHSSVWCSRSFAVPGLILRTLSMLPRLWYAPATLYGCSNASACTSYSSCLCSLLCAAPTLVHQSTQVVTAVTAT